MSTPSPRESGPAYTCPRPGTSKPAARAKPASEATSSWRSSEAEGGDEHAQHEAKDIEQGNQGADLDQTRLRPAPLEPAQRRDRDGLVGQGCHHAIREALGN